MKRPWWLERRPDGLGHLRVATERASAEVYGRLRTITSELEELVERREADLFDAEEQERDGG